MKPKYGILGITTLGLICLSFACDGSSDTAKPRADDSSGTPAVRTNDERASTPGSHAKTGGRQAPATRHAGDATQREHAEDHVLTLDGLTLRVPDGWKRSVSAPGPFAPVAVFELPAAGDDKEGGQVRITHFPGMKGKDDLNIRRWLGQVKKSDGSSYGRDEANLTVTENGNVRIKIIDLSGTVKATMRATPRADSRMIAAIVDHPRGPHFVVATGGVATMHKWEATIHAFLNSAVVSSP